MRSPDRQRRPQEPRAATPGSHAPDTAAERVLALQRSAGNAAVTRHLRALARGGWPEAREGGWNKQARPVAGTQRLVIKGLKQGHHEADTAGTPTTEKAGSEKSGRAVVIVPDGTNFATTGKLEVLLVFHGLGDSAGIGYRERTTQDDTGGAGTVHDIEADVIPQQLSSSGRNMIAILAQGKATNPETGTRFGIKDTAAYVKDVLAQVKVELAALTPPVSMPDNITPYRIVSAGHSGGGPQAVESAGALQGGAWNRAAPLFLFDAINGPNELKNLRTLLKQWLDTDLAHLEAAANPAAELAARGLKFRSTSNPPPGSHARYIVNNLGQDLKGNNTYVLNGKTIIIKKDESVSGFLDDWFAKNATSSKITPIVQTWRSQYQTFQSSGGHHHQIGTGTKAKKRDSTPTDVTGASKTEGVPVYNKGSGNLETSLGGLPKDALRPPPPPPPAPHAALEEELEDDPGKVFA